jgi:hypothetical protein
MSTRSAPPSTKWRGAVAVLRQPQRDRQPAHTQAAGPSPGARRADRQGVRNPDPQLPRQDPSERPDTAHVQEKILKRSAALGVLSAARKAPAGPVGSNAWAGAAGSAGAAKVVGVSGFATLKDRLGCEGILPLRAAQEDHKPPRVHLEAGLAAKDDAGRPGGRAPPAPARRRGDHV